MNIKSDAVDLCWSKCKRKVDYYQIRYKQKNRGDKWKFAETDGEQSEIIITGLMANTEYVFQIRGVYEDQEGSYGPANYNIQTPQSLAIHLLEFSECVRSGNPSIFKLNAEEIKEARNESAKIKKLCLGGKSLVLFKHVFQTTF